MITFKQYLTESERYTPISEDLSELLKFIEKHCSDAMWMLNDNTPIWRGISGPVKPTSVIDPTLSERQSANTSNHYTLLLDNSPYMKDFPKRSRSLIATTSAGVAGSYGKLYAIIPFNNVPIGVVGEYDIWGIKVKVFNSEQWFSSLPNRLASLVADTLQSFEDFDKKLKEGDRHSISLFKAKFPDATIDQRNNFLDTLYKDLSPERTGFKVVTTKDHKFVDDTTEVWIGGKCVIIHADTWLMLRKFMKEATE